MALEICASSEPPRGRPSFGAPSAEGAGVMRVRSSSVIRGETRPCAQDARVPIDATSEERERMSLTDTQRTTLRLFCDTIVPRIDREPDPDGFFARKATDIGVDQGVEQLIDQLDDELKTGLAQLLDALGSQGLERMPSQLSREQVLKNMTLASPEAAAGIQALTGMTLFLNYGMPDPETGQNPNWKVFGYPGPTGAPPQDRPKALAPIVPGDTLEADVVVVGSGAGGATIAGTLAKQGQKVVVLEASGYFTEADFNQLELPAYQEMYWRGGPTPTADGNVSLQAGTTPGGGTVINWTNCLRTYPWVREQWAREHGLEGVDGREYERHLDTVLERIGANDQASDLNGPQQRMKEGCEKLGWDFRKVVRNADLERYSYESAGHLGFGDQSGSKNSADKTWLADAAEHDADIVVRCHADRIITENGRAAGVEATYAPPGEEPRKVTVRAGTVVVACGSLESPALLLRSGIGGPAVGNYLRLHPALAVFGSYPTEQNAFLGAPHAGLSHEFENVEDGYGFLIEGAQYTAGLTGSAVPWTSGLEHKEMMTTVPNGASFICLLRDRGHGRVTVDENGEAGAWDDGAAEAHPKEPRRRTDQPPPAPH